MVGQTRQAAPLPQPIPDFGRLADPTTQTGIQFQTYDKTPLTFTSRTIYVQVPVVVTDKDGKPVAGLKKEDFHLQENGKEQNIASLEAIQSSTAPLARPVVPGNEVRNQTSSDATPRRLVIIALDMVNTPFEDQVSARRALINYLSDNIEPDSLYQLVAVENNGLRVLHDFTDETGPLIATLKSFASKVPTAKSDAGFVQRAETTEMGPGASLPTGEDPNLGTPFVGPVEFRIAMAAFLLSTGMQEIQFREANAASSTRPPSSRLRSGSAVFPGASRWSGSPAASLFPTSSSGERVGQRRNVIRGLPARHAIAGR